MVNGCIDDALVATASVIVIHSFYSHLTSDVNGQLKFHK